MRWGDSIIDEGGLKSGKIGMEYWVVGWSCLVGSHG